MTLPATMKALIQRHDGYADTSTGLELADAGEWMELGEVPVPTPGPGQALVRVALSPVNPSDVHFLKGEYGQPRRKGSPAGFEACGEVVAAGEGAEGLVGKRVAFVATASGTWAEYALTDGAMCIPLIDGVRDEDGSALIVNPLTALAMFDIPRQQGCAFVATAAGSQLGKLLAGLSKDHDVPMIAVVRRQAVADQVAALGARVALATEDPEFQAKFAAACKELKPRVLLDAVGDQVTADMFFAMPNHTQWISYGKIATEPPALTQMGQFIFTGKTIGGFWLSKWLKEAPADRRMAVVGEALQRFASGAWGIDEAARLSLDEAVGGFAEAWGKGGGKVFIAPGA
ncbi:alcohol dehydrogenase catalytic domain-containing protein [Rhodovulum sp. DZ06]|uniref:alcohol dehydrogenase catalytic domain-containing protein n=1 Tax=Rhodovulum sp. DZ06 TaxID=3425126 RepID=UPI003D345DDE